LRPPDLKAETLDPFFLADATAILGLSDMIHPSNVDRAFDEFTSRVEAEQFGFPRAVLEDLRVRARGEPITAWAAGLGSNLRSFAASIQYRSWLMRVLQIELGFEEGLEDIDGREPSIVDVAAYARQLSCEHRDFVVVTEDCGEVPLRPTMEFFCERFGWRRCNCNKFLVELELDYLLNEP
jgi:hypothetical protein